MLPPVPRSEVMSSSNIKDIQEVCCEVSEGLFGYSTLSEPASDPLLEPVTDMLGSTAIISARMSKMGCRKVSVMHTLLPFVLFVDSPSARSYRKC